MKILITGPQGSGKTTQAQILAKKLGLCLIDAGELIRGFAQMDNPEGGKVKEEMDKGEIVDDKIAASLVASKIASSECASGYVMDGYPRDFKSLELFDPEFDRVFYLHICDEEAQKRLLERGREDDTPEAIRKRLKLYHEQTEPVLSYYKKMEKLISIDGEQPVEKVSKEIEDVITKGNL